MSTNLRNRLLVACASLPLTACPGGSGSYMASTPMPQPVNPPPPPPSQGQSPVIFFGINTDTDFVALGLQSNNRSYPSNPPISDNSLTTDGVSVKFDAASHSYVISLPSAAADFISAADDGRYWYGTIKGTPFDHVAVFKPYADNLSYTSYGIADGYYTSKLSFFAFGSATPAAGIPVSGNATFDAIVAGATMDDSSHFPSRTISGSATLQFDFGAGTLAGHFDPILNYPAGPNFTNPTTANLGTYNFVNTVYGVGKTNFSGQLSTPGGSANGSFNGQFTGPAAQELMARWTAPYLSPGSSQWSQMFGVWVGKKH